jgi:serine-type D-Ala-D-Ala carboxypeptidase (penicillin-binding protein 5/6)
LFKYVRILALGLILTLFFVSTLQATPVSQAQSGEAVFVLDLITGKPLFAKNADAILAPASTTKLMTALLITKKSKLTDIVILGKEVEGVESATLGLVPGDSITVENLLYALLLASSNEAATGLAAYSSGSVQKFVAEMNKHAQEVGLKSTRFINPNGLPAVGHVTTAKEMATIAVAALADPDIKDIVGSTAKEITWTHGNSTKSVRLENTNRFLGVYPGVQGMKTGTTTEAGQCLVTSSDWACGKVLMVILNSHNRYNDTKNYLDQIYIQLQFNKSGKDLVGKLPIGF